MRVTSWPLQVVIVALIIAAVLDASPPRPRLTPRRLLATWAGTAGAGVAVGGLMRLTGYWWLIGAASAALVNLSIAVLWRDAGFVGLHRVDDSSLERRVRRLCREAGIDVATVESPATWPASMAITPGAIIGVRRGVRVIVRTEALEWPPPQLDAVIAHEIGHIRRRLDLAFHIASIVMYLAVAGILRALLAVLPHVSGSSSRDPVLLPAVVVAFAVSLAPPGLAFTWYRRATERQADLDALDFTRDPDAFEAVVTRYESSRSPSRWAAAWSEHPEPAERHALAQWWRQSRVVTFLFTDIEGSTELVERLGDEAWYELVREHNELVRASAIGRGGHEQDYAGDGFLFIFDDAGQAVLAAQDAQRELRRWNIERGEAAVRVRMGVHTGGVIRQSGEVFGREVHVAARIAAQAAGDEILVSAAVRDLLATSHRFNFRERAPVTLRGLEGEFQLADVVWQDELTPSG